MAKPTTARPELTPVAPPSVAHPELNPVVHPKENLKTYCQAVGLDEHNFIEVPVRPGIFIGAINLTPQTCAAMEEMSARRGHNRKLRQQAVEQYKHSMNTGGFDFTGQTIIVSDQWSLLDGHHRTSAGMKADKPFLAMVVFGISDKLFDIIDNSVGRSLADNMELAGQGRTAWLGAAINMLITAERSGGDPLGRLKVTVTPRERHQFVLDHPDLTLAKDAAIAIEQMIPVSLPETVYVLYLAHRVDAEKTKTFVERVISGADLPETDARLAFTKWAYEAEKRRGSRKGPKRKENLVALLKAVKCHFQQIPLPKLVVGKKEPIPEL